MRGINAMKQQTNSSLSLLVGLLSSAVAACSGVGQDGIVTVGIRPTVGIAAVGDAGGLAMPRSDVMIPILDGNSAARRGSAADIEPDATSGMFTSAGSGATSEGRIGGSAASGAGGSGAAGVGGSLGLNEDECGAIPLQPAGNVTSGAVNGSGLIEYDVDASNVFTGLRTRLVVPAQPEPTGTVFVWPGIQPTPNGAGFQPIGNGAVLSSLTWGPLCSADAPAGYSTWWIAPMYSNISSSDPAYAGCHRGKVALAEPTQLLDIDIRLEGTTWVQKVVNRDTMETSDFSMDLKGQAQGRAIFAIGLQTSNKPTEDIVFTNTVLSMDRSDPAACQPMMRGMHDFASKPRVSADGKHCCIDRIVLRAPRVMATTTDPP